MASAIDMLEIEAQLEAGTSAQPVDNSSEAGLQSAEASSNGGAAAAENFYSSSKDGTWKKFKKMVKHKKEGSSEVGGPLHSQPLQHQHTCQRASSIIKPTKRSILYQSVRRYVLKHT